MNQDIADFLADAFLAIREDALDRALIAVRNAEALLEEELRSITTS